MGFSAQFSSLLSRHQQEGINFYDTFFRDPVKYEFVFSNGKVQCSTIPSIDLAHWRENSPTTTTEKPSSAPSKESFASYSIMITVLLSVFLFLKF